MTAIIWSPQALLDLESIRDYIGHDSPRYAELVVRRLVMAVERLLGVVGISIGGVFAMQAYGRS